MRPWSTLPRLLLATLATLLAAASVLYRGDLDVRRAITRARPCELGFNKTATAGSYDRSTRSIPVYRYRERQSCRACRSHGSATALMAINGEASHHHPLRLTIAYSRGHPGDAIDLTVERAGETQPRTLHGIFRASRALPFLFPGTKREPGFRRLEIIGSFPSVLFLVVGFVVLFLRLEDANAWLLALLFCSYHRGSGFPELPCAVHSGLREFALSVSLRLQRFALLLLLYLLRGFSGAVPAGPPPSPG